MTAAQAQPESPDTRRVFATPEEFEAFRASVHAANTFIFGDWWLNTATRECSSGRLGWQEFEVLARLVRAVPNPVTSKQLAPLLDVEIESVRVYVRHLRVKIGAHRIRTTPAGYVFVPFPEAA